MNPSDWIAIVALCVSASAAFTTWRVHQDAGGRVIVKLNAAAYRPFAGRGALITNHRGAFKLDDSEKPQVELCQIIIENPGRTGVTVTEVALRIRGSDVVDKVVTPRSFSLSDFGADSSERKNYFRIEPYDRKTVYFDHWSVVDDCFAEYPQLREIEIRAQVTVAGKEQPYDSKNHGAWRIQRHFISAAGNHNYRHPRNVMLTEILRQSYSELSDLDYFDEWVIDLEEDLAQDATAEDIAEELQIFVNGPMKALFPAQKLLPFHLVAYNFARANERFGDKIQPFPVRPHKKQRGAESA